jgi:hypothetical protein
MTELEHIEEVELDSLVQSTATLARASAFAALLASITLIVAILPAEYGIDPTGIGKSMGLTTLATFETQNTASSSEKTTQTIEYREDSVKITVPAGKGLEYKFHLLKGDAMRYAWASTKGELFFDFHGEPDGDTTGYFESYTLSTASKVRGTFTASFNGAHGWYWKNSGTSPAIVTLETQGNYSIIGLK